MQPPHPSTCTTALRMWPSAPGPTFHARDAVRVEQAGEGPPGRACQRVLIPPPPASAAPPIVLNGNWIWHYSCDFVINIFPYSNRDLTVQIKVPTRSSCGKRARQAAGNGPRTAVEIYVAVKPWILLKTALRIVCFEGRHTSMRGWPYPRALYWKRCATAGRQSYMVRMSISMDLSQLANIEIHRYGRIFLLRSEFRPYPCISIYRTSIICIEVHEDGHSDLTDGRDRLTNLSRACMDAAGPKEARSPPTRSRPCGRRSRGRGPRRAAGPPAGTAGARPRGSQPPARRPTSPPPRAPAPGR